MADKSSSSSNSYELPPFELVQLLHGPIFGAGTSAAVTATAGPSLGGTGSPSATAPGGGALSPPAAGSAAAAAAASLSPPTLSGRLSQLVIKHQQRGPTAGPIAASPSPAGAGLSSAAEIATSTPEVSTSLSPDGKASSASRKPQTARYAESGGDTVWVAGNEGSVAVWKLDPSRRALSRTDNGKGKARAMSEDADADGPEEAAYLLDKYGVVPSKRPIEKLAVLSTVGKAVVLSEGILSVHSLPTFAPLPAFAPIRGVSTFAVDLTSPHSSAVPICLIKRRSMQLFHISQFSIELITELPLRTTAILGVLRRSFLCIADSVNYSIVDLNEKTLVPLLPISQDPPEDEPAEGEAPREAKPKSYQKPSIVPVEEDEFLVASHTGHTTLGLFIRENGEPTRGTLEWASNVKSIVVDKPHVIALLQNNTIEIHDLYTQESVQVISLARVGPADTALPAPRLGPSALSPPSTPATPPTHSRGVSSASSATLSGPAHLTSPFSLPPSTPKSRLEAFQPRALVTCAAGFPDRSYVPGNSTNPAFSPLFVPLPPGASSSEKVKVHLFPQQSLLDLPNDETDLNQHTETHQITTPEPPSTPKAGKARKAELQIAPASTGNRQTGHDHDGEALPLANRSAGPAASGLAATRPKHLLPASDPRNGSSSIVAANTLLLGRDSVLALCPVTLVVQADALIAGNRIDDALRLLEAVGKPDSAEKLAEICYVKQKAAWAYLFETRFKEAGPLFFDGQTDPRLLLRLFPDVVGGMMQPDAKFITADSTTAGPAGDAVEIYRGLQGMLGERTLHQTSIEGIISANLVRNYSPHLPPSSPSVTDLHEKLEIQARAMLKDFLRTWREQRRGHEEVTLPQFGHSQERFLSPKFDRIVDTSLAKLHLTGTSSRSRHRRNPSEGAAPPQALLDMLEKEAHDCDVDELAPLLEKSGLHWYLSQLLLSQGRVKDILVIWTELIDGERTDERFVDGLTKIFNLLENSTDAELVTRYGLWLVQRDRELGLRLFTRSAQSVPLEVASILAQLKVVDGVSADRYLEHVVFTRKSVPASYHDELVSRYIDMLTERLSDPEARSQLLSVREEYAEQADTAEETIVSFALRRIAEDSKGAKISSITDLTRLRAKLMLVLHGSGSYDIARVRERLEAMQELFIEKAIVYGRLGIHEEALSILASTLRDMASANAYCSHAGTGDVLTPKMVREILDKLHLALPTALFRKDGRRRQQQYHPVAGQAALSAADKHAQRKTLLSKLIKISLAQADSVSAMPVRTTGPEGSGDDETARQQLREQQQRRAARTIETQAVRLNIAEILPSIPDEWPLPLMESFVTRSFRRDLHACYERKLVKGILQEQASDATLQWLRMADAWGGILAEEEGADDNDDDGAGDEKMNEKGGEGVDEETVFLGEDVREGEREPRDDEKTDIVL